DVPGTFVATLCGNPELGIGVTVRPAQAHAALEYWRTNMIRVVEKVAAQFRETIPMGRRTSSSHQNSVTRTEEGQINERKSFRTARRTRRTEGRTDRRGAHRP